jgi:hypothetical protein
VLSTRPPIDPVRPSCFVVWIASKKINKMAERMKIPAMPWVAHGKCWAIQVLGARAGKAAGTFCGTAPFGKRVAAADGNALDAAATSKSGFNEVFSSYL